MATAIASGQRCTPNISESGRRRRVRFGWQMTAVSVALLVAIRAFHLRWPWAILLFMPAASAATGFLQVRRNTCVLRAQQGTFEHEDGSTTAAPEDQVRASRAVASTIRRDATLIGLLASALGALLSIV
jgi:hypothetical protein